MDLHPETTPSSPELRAVTELAELLLGPIDEMPELPPVADLTAAVTSLATGTRRKALLPLGGSPIELALVRRGPDVLVSCYETGGAPEVRVLDRVVELRQLLSASARAALAVARYETDPAARQIAARLAERALRADPDLGDAPAAPPVVRRGGAIDAPDVELPLAFGFEARIVPGPAASASGSSSADLHALLFDGTLWAFVRGRRVSLARGPIMLPVQRMIVAVRALCDAWEAGRSANVRLRSGSFQVGVRLARDGEVAITLGTDDGGAVTAAALDVPGAALPILRLASDLLRTLAAVDRAQSRNLRVRDLRDEVRALRRIVRGRDRVDGFVNRDPDRLRASDPGPPPERADTITTTAPAVVAPGALRYSERWRLELDGLDASALYLCGDRLLLSTPRHMLAVARESGEVLWARDGAGATSFVLGRTLVRVSPEGDVELCEVEDGEPYARARITPRVGAPPGGLLAGGGAIPPVAVLVEGGGRLVALDLRTAEPRWRFAARGDGSFRLTRAGRVLVVVCGDGAVHALDVATGEVAWRFTDRVSFAVEPAVCRDLVVALAGEPGGAQGAAYGLDLYSGQLVWRQQLQGAPSAPALATAALAAAPIGGGTRGSLVGLDARTGAVRFQVPDPGVGLGGASLAVDRSFIVNAPAGRVTAIDVESGDCRWTRRLSDPVADDVPRRLGPVLRGGALFVPAAHVHVLRPGDGTPLGDALPCDLVPDALRVDERGAVYIAEESGHVAAFAPVPHLRLIRGGA